MTDEPVVQNQPAPGDLTRGDYVFASRWSDCDPGDPWEVGFVSVVGEGYVVLSSPRHWPKAMRITPEQGKRICEQYPAMQHLPQDYEGIAKVFGVPTPGELEYASWTHLAGVAPSQAPSLPRSDSQEAADSIDAVMAERNHPSSTKAAGRAGWEAAFRWLRTHGVPVAGQHTFPQETPPIPEEGNDRG